jgi:hypothetical protein
LVYSGLTPGNFGYTIDQAQEGMIKSSRAFFFINSILSTEQNQGYIVYKFIQNGMYPKLLQEAVWEVMSLTIVTITVLVLKWRSKGMRENKWLRIAREIKSSVYVFSFIPFLVHWTNTLVTISFTKDASFWSILNIIAGVSISCIYLNHIMRTGTNIKDIKFLHQRFVYQVGKVRVEQGLDWAFDTYIH